MSGSSSGRSAEKTSWDEYWEARRSLDLVVRRQPQHVRALVARAWIDYIVDTRMPWGTRWVLGGGAAGSERSRPCGQP